MNIYLVRHGETASNAGRVVQTPDTPLSDRGLEQAARLASRLAGEQIDSILCSTLLRATMTADPVSSETGVPVTLRADLQERNYGDIRGLPYDEVGADILDPDYEPPGGETWREFHQRVDGVWTHIGKVVEDAAAQGSRNILVVTHGLVLYSLVSRLLDTSKFPAVPLAFRNTSVTIVEAREPWPVATINCAQHLGDESSSGKPAGAV